MPILLLIGCSRGGGGGVGLFYISFIGACGTKRSGFQAILFRKWITAFLKFLIWVWASFLDKHYGDEPYGVLETFCGLEIVYKFYHI